jgi:hypothetical protein
MTRGSHGVIEMTKPITDGSKCGAGKHQGDGTCRRPAGWGTDHAGTGPCKLHGGATPTVAKGSLLRLVEGKSRAMVATYGLPREIPADRAILEEIHRTAGHVAWLADVIQSLTEEELVWGTVQIKTGGDDAGRTEAAEPNVWLKLYREERAHLAKVCAEAVRCGIAERFVKLAEAQGALLVELIRGILADLALTPEQQALVPDVVPRHLRALSAA